VHTVTLHNPLNSELNPICHLLALLGAHHILHVSRVIAYGFLYFFSFSRKINPTKKELSLRSQYCSLVGVVTDSLCYGQLMYGSSAPNCRADRFVYAFIITVLRIQLPFFQRKSGLCLPIVIMFIAQEKLKKGRKTENIERLMIT